MSEQKTKDKRKRNLRFEGDVIGDVSVNPNYVQKEENEEEDDTWREVGKPGKSGEFKCDEECFKHKENESDYDKCIKECVETKMTDVRNRQLRKINADKEGEEFNRRLGQVNIDDIQDIIDFLVKHHYKDEARKQKLVSVLLTFKQENPEYPDIVEDIYELLTLFYERYSRNFISKTLFSNRSRFFRRIDYLIDHLEEILDNFEVKGSMQSNFDYILHVKGGRKTKKQKKTTKQKKQKKTTKNQQKKTTKNHQKKTMKPKRKINKSRKRI
jgi:hypothetical protein